MNQSKQFEMYTYEIKIEGLINPNHFREFENFLATSLPDGQTLIIGEAIDQSALYGVLIHIRDMGLSLTSLKRKPLKEPKPNYKSCPHDVGGAKRTTKTRHRNNEMTASGGHKEKK